jgi:hypothetical protein
MAKVVKTPQLTSSQRLALVELNLDCNVLAVVRSYVLGAKPAPQIPAKRLNIYVGVLLSTLNALQK